MGTLLLRLVGPMQSWGVQSDFTHRDTGFEPSKSGVIGMICAALGKPRDENDPNNIGKPPLAALAELRMGVRVDREGLVMRDWHTALDVYKADGKSPPYPKHPKFTTTSERYYLADAAFLVGLESKNADLLRQIEERLRRPVWMLFLGRKAFVPGMPVWLKDGLKLDSGLEESLHGPNAYPRLVAGRYGDNRARLIVEDSQRGSIVRPDQPISFEKGNRQFTVRKVRMDFCVLPEVAEETY